MKNYWIKDSTRQEIITKNLISNSGNLNIYANFYNLIDEKGLSIFLGLKNDFVFEILYSKNVFRYFVMDLDIKELYILPNENIVEYTNRVVSKLNICNSEEEVLKLIIDEMY
jgi:hypothetical protein